MGVGGGADVNQELKVLYNNNNRKYAGEAVGRVTVNQELKVLYNLKKKKTQKG